MSEIDELKICSICQKEYRGWRNNAYPVNDGWCCKICDINIVLPARFQIRKRQEKEKDAKV